MARQQQTVWGLTKAFIDDIEATCKDAASIYRNLETHNNYWGPRIKGRLGVKLDTVRSIARNFLRILRSVNENTFVGTGIDLETARKMYKKYEGIVASENLETVLEKVRNT